MQHIRHGAHILGQRTDAGGMDSGAPQPRQGCGHQQGLSSPASLSRRPRLSASDVSHDLHASLKALGTDFIDLYLLHYDHPTARSRTDHGTAQPSHRRRQDRRDRCVELVSRANCQRQHACRRQGLETVQRVERSIQPCRVDAISVAWRCHTRRGRPACRTGMVFDARAAGVRVVQPGPRIFFRPLRSEEPGWPTA